MKRYLYFSSWMSSRKGITEEDYHNLINYCFQYSSALSFSFNGINDSKSSLPGFSPFSVMSLFPECCKRDGGIIWLQHKKFYHLSDELRKRLLRKENSFFRWKLSSTKSVPEPEDLCFYRKDGSVLFWSCTHEGECAFFLRNDEIYPPIGADCGWELLAPEHLCYKGFAEIGEELKVEYGSLKTGDSSAYFGYSRRISFE